MLFVLYQNRQHFNQDTTLNGHDQNHLPSAKISPACSNYPRVVPALILAMETLYDSTKCSRYQLKVKLGSALLEIIAFSLDAVYKFLPCTFSR